MEIAVTSILTKTDGLAATSMEDEQNVQTITQKCVLKKTVLRMKPTIAARNEESVIKLIKGRGVAGKKVISIHYSTVHAKKCLDDYNI